MVTVGVQLNQIKNDSRSFMEDPNECGSSRVSDIFLVIPMTLLKIVLKDLIHGIIATRLSTIWKNKIAMKTTKAIPIDKLVIIALLSTEIVYM